MEGDQPISLWNRQRRVHLVRHDTSGAKTVLAVVGVAVAIVLIWLESKGY